MSNIQTAFNNNKAFIGFVTGGDPSLESSFEIILKMIEKGVDIIEIGIPFSDPVAEGPIIQKADLRALNAGITLTKIFELTQKVRQVSNVPIVYLTYYNPVFCYGSQQFIEKCKEIHVDGIIIPDLPAEERDEILPYCKNAGVDLLCLVAPTSFDRIPKIVKDATGYIYLVSSMGVTGVRIYIKTNLKKLIDEVRLHTNTPIAVGFGINTPEQAKALSQDADGIIIGSAIVSLIEQFGEYSPAHIGEYVASIKSALNS
ncbi:MAG: tryptophan synthase subunit alpha [Christensenellaceae bacterium]|jgi:tryptophan synthase alpha chain|nr:tryptophan synthase subunit alpha [Christensenellaceae bacterium]